jgi:hypothetical protein
MVPANELRVRPVGLSLRQQGLAARVDDGANAVRVVCLARDDDPQVIVEPDEPAVEYPVRRARQG